MGYGIVQVSAPALRKLWTQTNSPDVKAVSFWSAVLKALPALIAVALRRDINVPIAIKVGLASFGVVFAINCSIHSCMVLTFTEQEDVSLNVGFDDMANATGRLVGTILSGTVFMLGRRDIAGMQLCLWVSSCLVLLSWLSSLGIPSLQPSLACQSSNLRRILAGVSTYSDFEIRIAVMKCDLRASEGISTQDQSWSWWPLCH